MELYTVEVLKVRINLDTYLSSYELLDTVFIEEELSLGEVVNTGNLLLRKYHVKESLKPLFDTGSQVLNIVQISNGEDILEGSLDMYKENIKHMIYLTGVGVKFNYDN